MLCRFSGDIEARDEKVKVETIGTNNSWKPYYDKTVISEEPEVMSYQKSDRKLEVSWRFFLAF